jgi:hypothetical protein
MEKPLLDPKTVAKNQVKIALLSVFSGILISFLLAFPIKWLWNWLVPGLFAGPEISAIQAWGLTFLTRMVIPTNVTLAEPKKDIKNNPK